MSAKGHHAAMSGPVEDENWGETVRQQMPAHPAPSPAGRSRRHQFRPGNRAADLAAAAIRSVLGRALDAFYATWPYRQTLHGPMPDHLVHFPADLRPGRVDKADALFQGRYALNGGLVIIEDGTSPFAAEPPSDTWAEELHGFGWLRHFSAAGGDTARRHAQALVNDWIERCGRWHAIGWRPQVIARRLAAWGANAALILEDTDVIHRSALLRSMGRQARHLSRTAAFSPPGEKRLTTAIGLALSGLCLSEGKRRLARGLDLTCREIERQVLPDGGHISRNPLTGLSILIDLIALDDALRARDLETPAPVLNAIDRMTPMIRFFRHGDGRLALFNGAHEGTEGLAGIVLERDQVKGKPLGFAPHSGYQRMVCGPATVLFDAAPPPPGPFSLEAHAGTLAFEMSVGRARLVVNCGMTTVRGGDWHLAGRATAAHSTATVADTSSARLVAGRLSTALLGDRLIEGPSQVESRRNEEDGAVWCEGSHNGYAARFGLIHRRRLWLAPGGEDFRGDDVLEPGAGPGRLRGALTRRPGDQPFEVRFHLHPDARASLAHDHSNVLVLLPNGDGWQFRARVEHGESALTLEESVYLGVPDVVRRSEQIVVRGRTFEGNARIKWAWRRLSTRNAGKGPEGSAMPELPVGDGGAA